MVGYLCDQQQGYFPNKEVADFFLKDFLGCKLSEEPQITTKKFFDTTMQYLNDSDISAEEKTEFHTHLISELTNNNTSINILEFARRSLPADKIQNYMDELTENKVNQTTFFKNNQLILSRIKNVQYEFESGIKIIGENKIIKDMLTISGVEDGKIKVELIDALSKVVSK